MNSNKTYGIFAVVISVGLAWILFGVIVPRNGWEHTLHMSPMYILIATAVYAVIGLFWSLSCLMDE